MEIRLLPLVVSASLLAGCGSTPQVVVYPPDSGVDRGLHVAGTATVRAEPTLVVLRLGCTYSDPRPTVAKGKVDASGRRPIAAIKAAGIAAGEIQTRSFRLNASVDRQTGTKTWNCSTTVEVRVKKVSTAGDVLETALNNGANVVDSIEYTIEELQELRSKARDEACAIAKSKAEQFAKNFNVKLGVPTTISESAPGGWYFGRNTLSQSTIGSPGTSGGDAVESVLSSGSVAVDLTVNVTYSLESK